MIQWASPSTKIEKEISSFIEISYELFHTTWVSFCHMIDGLCVSSHVTKKHAMNSHDQNYVKNKL